MRSEDAFRVLLVQAIEEADAEGSVLPRSARLEALRQAASDTPLSAGPPDSPLTRPQEDFLVRRAEILWERVRPHCPPMLQQKSHFPGGGWWWAGLLIGAFVMGALAHELGSGHRLNLLSFPLLGMLIWNGMVYALLAVRWISQFFRTGDRGLQGSGFISRVVACGVQFNERSRAGAVDLLENEVLKQGLTRFAVRWAQWARPFWEARVARGFHLAAVMFAAGLTAALYLRGLSVEYVVGWESTFLGPGFVHGLIHILLSPASWLLDIPLPGVEDIQLMRWSEGGAAGNAGPWIHLFATTAVLFIVVPRLLLTGGQFLRERHFRQHFPLPDGEVDSLRRLCRVHPEGKERVWVLPHNLELKEPDRVALKSRMGDWLEAVPQVEFSETVTYGEEEDFLTRDALLQESVDYWLVLFNLAATPETEVQGGLLAGLRSRIPREAPLLALLDESHFRERFSHQEGFAERLGKRIQAWKDVVEPSGARVVSCDLRNPGTFPASNPFNNSAGTSKGGAR